MNSSEKRVSNETENKLQKWFSGFRRVVILGIGNPLRKDDYVGVEIIKRLRNKVSRVVHLIECETVPESFMKQIVELEPSHILIIDAALLNQEPGVSKLFDYDKLKEQQAVSTHALPLRVFCQYLAKTMEAKIALLLIQPKDTSFGEGLTPDLKNTVKQLTKLLFKILGNK
jgi:hydrogenase 3 maturation protease